MMDGFDRAGSVFSSRMAEVLGNIRVRETHSFFVRWQGELFKRDTMRADLRADLNRALNVKDATESVLYRGLMLQLYGAFERLVADLAAAVLTVLQVKASRYGDLDENLKNAHTVGSARLLARLHDKAINGVKFDFAALQSDLAACLSNAQPYRMNAAAFTALLGVCTAERVDALFKSLRLVAAFDDDLGHNKTIKAWAKDAGPREAYKLASDQLDEIVRLRNQIAHGASNPEVLDTQVKEAACFLSVLGQALLDKARARCT